MTQPGYSPIPDHDLLDQQTLPAQLPSAQLYHFGLSLILVLFLSVLSTSSSMHAQLTSQSCSRSLRLLQGQSGHFRGRVHIRNSQQLVNRAAASSSTAEMTVTGDQQLPAVYKRLVAKRTGNSFTDVAEVEEVPLPVPGANEVTDSFLHSGLRHLSCCSCCPAHLLLVYPSAGSMLLQTACIQHTSSWRHQPLLLWQ